MRGYQNQNTRKLNPLELGSGGKININHSHDKNTLELQQ
jgi:hypothetical protein